MAHRTRLPGWARARGAALNDFSVLTPGRTALVNIDMQNVFLAEDQVFGNRLREGDIVSRRVNSLSAGDAPVRARR